MKTSKTIAGLIGPTLVAITASILLNIGSFPELAEQVSRDPALIFVSGSNRSPRVSGDSVLRDQRMRTQQLRSACGR
jgi:hypothetical protein